MLSDLSTLISKKTQQSIKEGNTRLIFNTLIEYQPISRAGIKKLTKLSATTVSSLVEELISEDLVEEIGLNDTSMVGRKAVLLRLNPKGAYFLGIEITNTHLKSDLYNLSFEVIKSREVDFSGSTDLTLKLIDLIEKTKAITQSRLFGVTIGVPALVDSEEHRVVSSTVMETLPDRKTYQIVSDLVPDAFVCLKNNSSFVVYAEKEHHKNIKNLFSVDINDGVGAGLVVDGELVTGQHGLAGEFGHLSVDYNGAPCPCGNRGCIEGLVSVRAILKRMSERYGKKLSLPDAVALLDEGDKIIKEVLDESAGILAIGINSVLNLIDSDLVVINGEIKAFGEHLLVPLKAYIEKTCFKKRRIQVEMSVGDGNSVTLGGAYYAFRTYFNKEN